MDTEALRDLEIAVKRTRQRDPTKFPSLLAYLAAVGEGLLEREPESAGILPSKEELTRAVAELTGGQTPGAN